MRRGSDGYTILEVMIFLAISAALLASSMKLISGKQAQVEFDTKMRETQSRLNDWVNDVATGFTGGDPTTQTCFLDGGGRPYINPNRAPDTSYTPSCIFLGKAIQFTDQAISSSADSTIYVYSVFGRRVIDPATGAIPTDLQSANPAPAVGTGGGQPASSADLTEIFSLGSSYVKSVTGGSYANSHMIGFFNSFNTEQSAATNGNTDLSPVEYSFTGASTPADQGNTGVMNCLELLTTAPCNSNLPKPLTSYRICISDGSRTAQITISSNGGIGAATSLAYLAC